MQRTSIRTSIVVALALGALAAPLAAQDRRGPPRGGPTPEALAACSAHVSGASCTFSGRGGEHLTGTCVSPSTELPLACLPAGGAHHGPPPGALAACSGIDVGEACAVDTPRGDTLEGTCRATRHGTACVPAHVPGPDGATDAP